MGPWEALAALGLLPAELTGRFDQLLRIYIRTETWTPRQHHHHHTPIEQGGSGGVMETPGARRLSWLLSVFVASVHVDVLHVLGLGGGHVERAWPLCAKSQLGAS